MNTKRKILELFEENRGIYFSGEAIAEKLSISRTAVWKAVKSLRSEGYDINAIRNKGYCFSIDTDILSISGIQKYLNPMCKNIINLEVLQTVNSTNTLLKEKALKNAPEGYTIVVNNQTNGKGRLGRSFFSPADTGVYMSILLRPKNYSSKQATNITTMAAVAVCEAIEKVTNRKALIKWVNDIYIEQKKVSGILTEATFGLEDGLIDYVVLGIGINVYPPENGFPNEIKDIAGTLFYEAQSDKKNELVAECLNCFLSYYLKNKEINYIEEYRKRSFLIGKDIKIILPEGLKKAKAIGIDDNCYLIIKYENGKEESLSSGELVWNLKKDGDISFEK